MRKVRLFFGAIVFAVAAFGQPIFSPGQVRLGAIAGSSAPVTDLAYLVSSSSSYESLNFTISCRYLGTTQGWLSVTPTSGTIPTRIEITADPTNLEPGAYYAQLTASVGPLGTGAWANVTLIVAPANSNPSGLAASPTALTFLPESAGSVTPQSISIMAAPGVTGTLPFFVFANPSDWLTVSQTTQTTPGTVTVQPWVSGLSAGIHTGTVTITTQSGYSTVVPVTLVAAASGSGPGVVLTPAQHALIFNFQLATSLNPSQTVFVSTSSTISTSFTATASDSWIRVANASYVTPAATAQCFAPGLFYVSVDPTGLPAGHYDGKVTLSASGASSVDIPVTLNVSALPVLNASPSYLSLDTVTKLLTSNLAVTASTPFNFTATVSAPWLTVTPSSATASAYPDDLTVTANPNGLVGGTYNAVITLTGNAGTTVQSVPVQFHVANATTSTSTLTAAPASIAFTGISGAQMFPQYVQVAAGTDVGHITAAATSDTGWLSVDPLSGAEPMLARVSADSTLQGGSYNGSLVFTSLETGDQASVNVSFTVTPRVLTVAPTILTFVQQAVGAKVVSQDVQVTANAPSTFRIVRKPGWSTIAAPTVLATPAVLTVSADPTGMAPGAYQDTIVLSGPSDVAIPVAFTVAAPAPAVVTPTAISFAYQMGAPAPPTQTIQIANPSGAATFTAAASTASGIPWLTVTPLTGSTPGSVAVAIAVSQLVPGQSTGTVTVGMQDGTRLAVPVTVTVTGSAVQVQSVLNGATLTPATVAPGEILTLKGYGLGHDTAAVAQPGFAGSFGTQLAGTQVMFDGIPAPLLMVQSQQINTIAPYELYGRSSVSIQVQSDSGYSIPISVNVTAATPGIFTAASAGSGEAAALNADSTPNSVLNPAARGSVIVLYLTGEGQTDPPGQDGRVILTDLRKPLLPVTATIGGVPAEVLYAGSGPTLVSGICQVNLRIPQSIEAGTQPVEIQIGGIPSQHGVTIELR